MNSTPKKINKIVVDIKTKTKNNIECIGFLLNIINNPLIIIKKNKK
jgi:hypothetical protein